VRLEHVLALGVADAFDNITGDLLHVQIGFAFHLTGQHHLPGGHQRFAGYFAFRIECEEVVDKCITDLVGDFVGVAFADGFRR
jgi:hypothetical protein